MTKKERKIRAWAVEFYRRMRWGKLDIIRIKLCLMRNYQGLMIPDTSSDGVYILLSLFHHQTNKQLFATLIHELIHAKILSTKHWRKSAKHGGIFRQYAMEVVEKTNGFYSLADII